MTVTSVMPLHLHKQQSELMLIRSCMFRQDSLMNQEKLLFRIFIKHWRQLITFVWWKILLSSIVFLVLLNVVSSILMLVTFLKVRLKNMFSRSCRSIETSWCMMHQLVIFETIVKRCQCLKISGFLVKKVAEELKSLLSQVVKISDLLMMLSISKRDFINH